METVTLSKHRMSPERNIRGMIRRSSTENLDF
jgi:hypothetical protein